jgi:hypothetical protein
MSPIESDDQSQVQISVTRIEDLDEGKTYNNTDANWSSIVNQYATSADRAHWDGHAVDFAIEEQSSCILLLRHVFFF